MKSTFTFLAFLFFSALSAQSSFNTEFLSNWNDPNAPVAQFNAIKYSDVWGYVDETGREYALLGSSNHAFVIDVTNPKNPIEKAAFLGGDTTVWRQMKVYRDYAYFVCDACKEGYMVIDLRPLPNQAPILVRQDTMQFKNAHMLYVDTINAKLYINGANTFNNGLHVYDLKAKNGDPVHIASVETEFYVHDLHVRDNIAYLSQGYRGLAVWDFTDPKNPVKKASVQTNGYNHATWLSKDKSWLICAEEVPTGLPLLVIDVKDFASGDLNIVSQFADPLTPTAMDSLSRDSMVYHNPYLVCNDSIAVVSSYEDGVTFWNMKDLKNPKLAAYYDFRDNKTYNGYFSCWGVYPFLPSGNILASDMQDGLYIIRSPLTNSCNQPPTITLETFVQEIQLINNPVTENLTFILSDSERDLLMENGGLSTLKIMDITGNTITQQVYTNQRSIEVNNLSPGMYILDLAGNGYHGVAKFIKL
jgi:choice-of-anchor B domain-containing protein